MILGKLLKYTEKIFITEEILVLVNVKENFLQRRSGLTVYLEIKKSLEKLHYLKIINRYELTISKIIQKISRVYLSKYFLSLIYKFNRKETKF